MRLMTIVLAAVFASLFVSTDTPAQDEGKLVREAWDALYLGGAKCGLAHLTTREVSRDGKPLLVTTLETSLQMKRDGAISSMAFVQKCEETPDGKVRGLGVVTKLDKGEVTQFGTVQGDKFLLKVSGSPQTIAIPWVDDAIGLAKQDRQWSEVKLKPGLVTTYRNFDPMLGRSIVLTATVQDREDAVVLEDRGTPEKPRGEQVKKSLWRVLVTADPIEIAGQRIPMPDQTLWLDDAGTPLRGETVIPGLGKMTNLRVNKALALLKDAVPAEMPDLIVNSLIKLNRPIPKAHDAKKIVYRVVVPGDPKADTTLTRDTRQSVAGVQGDRFELTVKALREPADVGIPAPVEEEFLRSTQLLDSDHEKIKELAKKITAGEPDPWTRARKVEKWVHDNMTGTMSIGLARASQVCVDLKGDCRQFGMLTAALCRAAGVPARTALGLVYVEDSRKGPLLGFHLWTEVWVKGQWMGLDATLGRGSIGPAHIKVTDSSWKDGDGLAPMLLLVRVLGRLNIEVVSVE